MNRDDFEALAMFVLALILLALIITVHLVYWSMK